jgi:hypothetical protein
MPCGYVVCATQLYTKAKAEISFADKKTILLPLIFKTEKNGLFCTSKTVVELFSVEPHKGASILLPQQWLS